MTLGGELAGIAAAVSNARDPSARGSAGHAGRESGCPKPGGPPSREAQERALAKALVLVSDKHPAWTRHDLLKQLALVMPPETRRMDAPAAQELLHGLADEALCGRADIADAVCQVLVDARTDLVLVDEIHNLNHGTPAGEDLSDHLKYFTEHLPATFIYAGIDVERCGVFTGTRGRQLAGRCGLIGTGAFPYRDEWAQLIAALEATLRLHHHQPGALAGQAKYLHQRTGGMIGSLTHLIRGAAIRAILGGQEALTRALLDTVRIDHAAESATRRASSTR